MKKRIFSGLLVLLALVLLAGCGGSGTAIGSGEKTSGTKSGGTTTAKPSAADGVAMVQNGEAAVKIAYAAADAEATAGAIETLRTSFAQKLGVTLAEPSVWQESFAGEPCIAFGNIGDETASALYAGMRTRGYAVAVNGKTVYIAAQTTDGYAMAVNAMVTHLKKLAGNVETIAELSLEKNYSVNYEGRYSLMNAQINGVELKDLEILAPTDARITSDVLETLSANLTDFYGYRFQTASQAAEGKHYIRMEIDSSIDPQHYGYRVKGGDLCIVSAGGYSMKLAARAIGSVIRPDNTVNEITLNNGDVRITHQLDNPTGLVRPANADLRVMSANVAASFWTPEADEQGYPVSVRGEIFDSYLQVYDPDVVGLQEFCDQWMDYVTEKYAGTPWKLATGGGERMYFLNAILYRSDRYTLVTSGWENYPPSDSQAWGGRYMCWAVLQKIGATEPTAAVLNVHWTGEDKNLDANRTQMQLTHQKLTELQNQYHCPVAVTGDFNTRDFLSAEVRGDAAVPNAAISHKCYTELLADGTVKDAKFYCDKQVNDIGDVHGWGGGATARIWSFAHIFVSSDTSVRQFYTAWDNDQEWLSDHAFLIADIDTATKKAST